MCPRGIDEEDVGMGVADEDAEMGMADDAKLGMADDARAAGLSWRASRPCSW